MRSKILCSSTCIIYLKLLFKSNKTGYLTVLLLVYLKKMTFILQNSVVKAETEATVLQEPLEAKIQFKNDLDPDF